MIIKTTDLTDLALDWAVAKCEGRDTRPGRWCGKFSSNYGIWQPSTDPIQARPIVDREGITLRYDQRRKVGWEAFHYTSSNHALTETDTQDFLAFGPTSLIAAMRCFVLSRVGDEIEMPDELC